MARERWEVLEDFPEYAVSDHGRVINLVTDMFKVATINQQGIASVQLVRNYRQYRRGLALLVASYFLPAPNREIFNTPINLDGDRLNNHVDNLEWRPRWFAMKYHSQFYVPSPFGFKSAVGCLDTNESFETVRDCAKRYGLLEKDIILSVFKSDPVFPTWQRFEAL